jgi:hypothetical protein
MPILGIQRTELDEAIERIVTSVAKVDSVRHVPTTLLMPERDHRLDLDRLARGNLAGDESHDDQ